jgi:hypothetical protein
VITSRIWSGNLVYWKYYQMTLDTQTSTCTLTHVRTHTHALSHGLHQSSSKGLQLWMFPSYAFPNCPLASATATLRSLTQFTSTLKNNYFSHNCSCSSLYILCKDHTENTTCNVCYIIACIFCLVMDLILYHIDEAVA